MKIYWTLKSIPELAEMSANERKAIWRRCYLKASRNWRTWMAYVACMACVGLGAGLGQIWGTIGALIGGAIGGSIGGFIWAQVAIQIAIPYIREDLHSQSGVYGA